ncbi:MAG: FtsQ-type POTRA domain-containing protein [Clostridia bacterium]|nr:FtsQ-type POTRA domain-containing protein [Clostridia bacterium]
MSENKQSGDCAVAALMGHLKKSDRSPKRNRCKKSGKDARVCVVRSMSSDPVSALLPAYLSHRVAKGRVNAAETDEVLPSGLRFSYHLRRRIVRRTMLLCLTLSLVCVLSVVIGSSVRVRSMSVSGQTVYTEDEIRTLSGVSVGDELFVHSEEEIRARLLAACSYLKEVRVRRGSGGFSITLTECVPRYALSLEDGRIALMDETYYVADIVDGTEAPDALCVVALPLPTITLPAEDGEGSVQREQMLTAGSYIRGSNEELVLLEEITRALDQVSLGERVDSIDLTDRYAVSLTLDDGTRLDLHSAQQPARQMRLVASSLTTYAATHGVLPETSRLIVDVDDSCRVSIRSVPKT